MRNMTLKRAPRPEPQPQFVAVVTATGSSREEIAAALHASAAATLAGVDELERGEVGHRTSVLVARAYSPRPVEAVVEVAILAGESHLGDPSIVHTRMNPNPSGNGHWPIRGHGRSA